jgi:hypothetical protein
MYTSIYVGHPNVVRYFLRETKNEFVYLALQLCIMNLRDFTIKLNKIKKKKEKFLSDGTLIRPPGSGVGGLIPDQAR